MLYEPMSALQRSHGRMGTLLEQMRAYLLLYSGGPWHDGLSCEVDIKCCYMGLAWPPVYWRSVCWRATSKQLFVLRFYRSLSSSF
jgi:hypothetical protein